ncbi:ABC transporter permease [Gryllotalpicola protaetiae]|uniref:ABC transporter permease n=1 Tax=Gryllotalpicola protaetiae TaxID=2419771 RepID=UPI001FE9BC70|nr:ABC transporter permease [Gryllotalpicola protaetiae]
MTSSTLVRPAQRTPFARYRHSLWLLTKRDLSVRYTTNALGYVWSVLDPLLMSLIYFFVFVVVFKRGDHAGEDPYIVYLMAGLLPWTWFNGAITDAARVFAKESKLVRSVSLPQTLWVARIVLSKGIEYVASLAVLVIFAILFHAPVTWYVFWFPVGLILQAILVYGIGLIVAPLTVFYKDLERAIRLILRLFFYASAILYSPTQWPEEVHGIPVRAILQLNPLTGIMGLYRSAFWPKEFNVFHVIVSAVGSLVILGIGFLVFRRSVPAVLKEM